MFSSVKTRRGGVSAKKVFIESMNACFANEQEGEKLRQFFKANGWKVVSKPEEADLILFNGCAFDKKKEDAGLQRIRELQGKKNQRAEMIVSGCLPGINPGRLQEVFDGKKIDARSFDQFDLLFKKTHSIREFKTVSNRKERYLLEIASGCLGRCTFCGIKNAIGNIRSRPIQDIRREFQLQLAGGMQHFVLTSHDFGAYGRDIGQTALQLLRELLKISGDYVLELDWMDPYWMRRDLEEYTDLLQEPRIRKAFFMPLQSGNNRILKLMGRKYTVEQFLECLETLLEKVKEFEPQTEVIVGFPTETENEFLDTLRVLGRFMFANIQAYAFDPKPNTPAAMMEGQIPDEIKEERRVRLHAFVQKNNFLWRRLRGLASHLDKTTEIPLHAN